MHTFSPVKTLFSISSLTLLLLVSCKDDPAPNVGQTGSTISCQSNSECPEETPECHPQSRICVGCIAGMTTCPVGQICQEGTHRCIERPANYPECTRNSECPPIDEVSQRSICDTNRNVCVECLSDLDCGDPKPACDTEGINGRSATYACVDGCETCIPPFNVCNREQRRCETPDGQILDAGVGDSGR